MDGHACGTVTADLYAFACKYYAYFLDPGISEDQLTGTFPKECRSFGFSDAYQEWFCSHYSREAYTYYEDLDRILGQIEDTYVLGSVLFTRFQELSQGGCPITLMKDCRDWFAAVLCQMAVLSAGPGDWMPLFTGDPESIRLESRLPEEQVVGRPSHPLCRQVVELHRDGKARISTYTYEERSKQDVLLNRENRMMEETVAEDLLRAMGRFFSRGEPTASSRIAGTWNLTIRNRTERTFSFAGSLCAELIEGEQDLSDRIREALQEEDLWLFDGLDKQDRVEKISLEYTHTYYLPQRQALIQGQETWEQKEYLEIDRTAGTLVYRQQDNQGRTAETSCVDAPRVGRLLATLDGTMFQEEIPGHPANVQVDPAEATNYLLKVTYRHAPQLVLMGSYDKKNLPYDWNVLMEAVVDFLGKEGRGRLLDPQEYQREKRCVGDVIVLQVRIGRWGNPRYYLTEDDTIAPGDQVVVPNLPEGMEAKVQHKMYVDPRTTTMPLASMNFITAEDGREKP